MRASAVAVLFAFTAACGGETIAEQLNADATVTPPRGQGTGRIDAAMAPDARHARRPDSGRPVLPDAAHSAPPDSGHSAPPDAGQRPPPDSGHSAPPDAGQRPPPDSGHAMDTGSDAAPDVQLDGGPGDAEVDTGAAPDAGPMPCPDAGCGPGQICFLPCMLCEAALLCGPTPGDGGVCPPGYGQDDECAPYCRQLCPPPTCVAASYATNCSTYQGGPDYCVEPCQ